ncbi:MAG: beta/gamma crystallin domain-containing protein [Nitrosospira sp.]
MSILIKSSCNFLSSAAVVVGMCVTTVSVYAQQPPDNTKAGKSMSVNKSKSPSKPENKDGETIVEVPVIVMAPLQVSKDLVTANGCWVKLYDKRNFEGDSLLLIGPIDVARMIDPFGDNWENRIYSLETGPNANVTIYNNRDFRDEDKFIDPDKKIPDMSNVLGLFRNFRSIMLSCIP